MKRLINLTLDLLDLDTNGGWGKFKIVRAEKNRLYHEANNHNTRLTVNQFFKHKENVKLNIELHNKYANIINEYLATYDVYSYFYYEIPVERYEMPDSHTRIKFRRSNHYRLDGSICLTVDNIDKVLESHRFDVDEINRVLDHFGENIEVLFTDGCINLFENDLDLNFFLLQEKSDAVAIKQQLQIEAEELREYENNKRREEAEEEEKRIPMHRWDRIW